MITPIIMISSSDINSVWEQLLAQITLKGNDFVFGDMNEQKRAREMFCVVQLYGDAIQQLYDRAVHEQYPLKDAFIKQHCDEYLNEDDYNPHGFTYTYIQQLRQYPSYADEDTACDQIAELLKDIKKEQSISKELSNNRHIVLINDLNLIEDEHAPCWQLAQVRRVSEKGYSLRLVFRSHDYGTAILSNLCAISNAFNELVFKRSGTHLEEIILVSMSGHIHDTDSDVVRAAIGLEWNDNDITKLMIDNNKTKTKVRSITWQEQRKN